MISTSCANDHPHQRFLCPKKPFDDLEIPPRKLLLTKKTTPSDQNQLDMIKSPFDTNLRKFLPYKDCKDAHHNELDPFTSDHFRMYDFKVRRCTRSRSHDWTDCPFAHPGEKARRRDPRRFHYSGAVCPEFRRGGCSRGDNCKFSHGVFECWLHPSRYRTEACKDGKNCKRKVCFFAHSPRQLRILPESSCGATNYDKNSFFSGCCCCRSSSSLNQAQCCCFLCQSVTPSSSPTSTLLGISHISPPMSPSLSPPLSPAEHRSITGQSTVSARLREYQSGVGSYKDVLTELISPLEALDLNSTNASSPNYNRKSNTNTRWIDASSFNEAEQTQFILSPSTPINNPCGNLFNNNGDCLRLNDVNGGGLPSSDPDLRWVNELLM